MAASLAALCLSVPVLAQTITATQGLSFGSFVAGSGGTIAISPQGTRTAGGDVTLMTVGQSSQGSAALFDLTGSPNSTYTISLPSDNVVTLTGSQGGSMAISAFSSTPSGTGQLSSAGTQTIAVGATLAVSNDQIPGSYSGSFNVTAVFE